MGAKILQLKISVAFPFYTNNNNDHVIKMPDYDWVRKMCKDNCKTRTKKINRPRVKIGYCNMENHQKASTSHKGYYLQ